MQITRNKQHILLTPAELQEAYREMELRRRVKDAEHRTGEFCRKRGYQVNIFEKADCEAIARQFMGNYDSSVAEDTIFDSVIEEYFDRSMLEQGKLKDDVIKGREGL